MNEITRIHIAKIAYDIEITAKKQLEKYIKSLELYTQDSDVLSDVEVRITELLAEHGVAAGGVIGIEDVRAVRKQLGEPHEFAAEDGDIATGSLSESSRSFYRSTDNAVLGGVLSGIAAFFNVNPLWTRLVFVLLLFISFGTVSIVYIVLWIIMPAARTATEKLRMSGREVTIESIKDLNADEEHAPQNRVAPLLQQVFAAVFGSIFALSAAAVLGSIIWAVAAALTADASLYDTVNGFIGLGDDFSWLVWLLFWVIIAGLALLAGLFSLISYAFFMKKLTKKMIISGVVIIVLGIAAFATVVGVGSSQSFRVANETRALVKDTKVNLSKDFSKVTTVEFVVKSSNEKNVAGDRFGSYHTINYVVDEGAPRYELNALPNTKVVTTIDGTRAVITVDTPASFRNAFVQPNLTVYGPALSEITANKTISSAISYMADAQAKLTIASDSNDVSQGSASLDVSGTFDEVTVMGNASVNLSASTVTSLIVKSTKGSSVTAGTIRTLEVTQPDVCPSDYYGGETTVEVTHITSEKMKYNGEERDATSVTTGCARVVIGTDEDTSDMVY